jgi:hypothetical protein
MGAFFFKRTPNCNISRTPSNAAHMGLIANNHVIGTFAADGADQSFGMALPPWRTPQSGLSANPAFMKFYGMALSPQAGS